MSEPMILRVYLEPLCLMCDIPPTCSDIDAGKYMALQAYRIASQLQDQIYELFRYEYERKNGVEMSA